MSFVKAFLNVGDLSWEAIQKGRHPAYRSIWTGSPIPIIARRCRIGVRHNEIENECYSFPPFLDSLSFLNSLEGIKPEVRNQSCI